MKKKLSLKALEVRSFVTAVPQAESLMGGAKKTLFDCMTNNSTMNPICDTFTLTNTVR